MYLTRLVILYVKHSFLCPRPSIQLAFNNASWHPSQQRIVVSTIGHIQNLANRKYMNDDCFKKNCSECIPSLYYVPCSIYFLFTFKNPAVDEKYLAFASATFFSAAWGLTISSPWSGVKATLDAVPLTDRFIVVLPPYTCACWRLLCGNGDKEKSFALPFNSCYV